MTEIPRQRLIAYGIIGVLALVLVGVLIYTQISSRSASETPVIVGSDVAKVGGLRADEASQPFNVRPLQQPGYTSLNRTLLDSGRVPVPPPSTRGKPNPFGL